MGERLSPEQCAWLRDIHRRHGDRIYAVLYRMTRGDKALAEDLTEETFLYAACHWDEVRYADDSQAWLCRVAANKVIDVFRRQERERASLLRLTAVQARSERADVHDQVMTRLAMDRLSAVLVRLSERQYLVAVLWWWFEWKNKEIADALGISPGRVTQIRDRVSVILRAELRPYVSFGTRGEESADD